MSETCCVRLLRGAFCVMCASTVPVCCPNWACERLGAGCAAILAWRPKLLGDYTTKGCCKLSLDGVNLATTILLQLLPLHFAEKLSRSMAQLMLAFSREAA